MENYTYNIIWADDEVMRFIKDSQYQQFFKRFNIKVLRGCPNGKSFKAAIQELWNYRIDAVITDANFPHEDFDSDKERDIDGLRTVIEVMSSYPTIPVYLYTGRKDINEIARQRDLENFDIIYHKDISETDNLPALLKRLCEDVDARKTTEFSVDNNFKQELEIARKYDFLTDGEASAEEFVRTNLIRSFDNRWDFGSDKPRGMLTSAQMILESIRNQAIKLQIVPPISSLNELSRFFSQRPNKQDKYELLEAIMPTPLCRAFYYCEETTQNGRHLADVESYIKTVQNGNMLRSILHIIIDILTWFVSYSLTHQDREINASKWQRRDNANNN